MSKLVATNFLGNLTRFPNGALDSGKCIDRTSLGYHPWTTPGCIIFTDGQADITGSIDGVIIDGQPRDENGTLYVYMIAHTSKLYKIQVNDLATKNMTYDHVTLIGTLTTATSFTMGGTMHFFASKIFIGHDQGVTSVNFDGSEEAFVGELEKWEQNVPRQGKIFFGSLYYTNGKNIATINNVGAVITYTTINDVPDDQIFKTIEVDATGTLLNLISSNIPNTSLVITEPNIQATYIATSYVFKWDARKNKVMSIKNLTFDQTAALTVGAHEYLWGYDVPGGSFLDISEGIEKIASGTGTFLVAQSPTANAVTRTGNLVGWVTVEPYPTVAISNVQGASIFLYGNLDRDEPEQIYGRLMSFKSSLAGGDIIRVPWILLNGNIQTSGDTSGYGSGLTKNQTGTGRVYISTVEFDGVNTAYKLYAVSVVNPFLAPCAGVYETQAVLAGTNGITASDFSPSAVDVYMEPATGYEEFTVDLIGIDGLPISGDTNLFTSFGTAAAGSVTIEAELADGVTIEIIDADGTDIIFEFDNDASVSGGNIPVTLGGTAALTADALAAAIEAQLNMIAISEDGVITLHDITVGVSGNQTITIVGSDITAEDMDGGVDTNISPGDIKLSYTPESTGDPALGIRITNSGLFTPIIHKIEITY